MMLSDFWLFPGTTGYQIQGVGCVFIISEFLQGGYALVKVENFHHVGGFAHEVKQ